MPVDPSGGVTLALGGIGLRGIANIGVLRACVDMGLRINGLRVTGVSSVVAARFALERDLEALIPLFVAFFREHRRELWGLEAYGGLVPDRRLEAARSVAYFLRESLFCRANLSRMSVFPWSAVEPALVELFGDAGTEDLSLPLAVGAVDIVAGREVVLREAERVVDLLKVGLALPGLFPPVELSGRTYVNSALFQEVPLGELVETERPVFLFVARRRKRIAMPRSLLEVLARADELRERALSEASLVEADAVVKLDVLGRASWASLSGIEAMVEAAYRETKRALSQLSGT